MTASVNPGVAYPRDLNSHAAEHAAMGLNKTYPYILSQGAVPIGVAPTGTMGANGAVTLGTALNMIYAGGAWLYYPAGAVFSGSAAGFYWTVMSSTTAGTVYSDTYSPGTSSFAIPSSPTAVVDAGPGAFTGSTSEVTAVSVSLIGGSLGVNGALTYTYRDARAHTAGNKTVKAKLGGTITTINNVVPNQASFSVVASTRNMGSEGRQSTVAGLSDTGGGTATPLTQTTIDTSVDQAVSFTLQLAAATDFVIMNGYSLLVSPS